MAFDEPAFVFVNAPYEVVGHSDVNYSAGTAGKEIHVIVGHRPYPPKRDGRDKPGHDKSQFTTASFAGSIARSTRSSSWPRRTIRPVAEITL